MSAAQFRRILVGWDCSAGAAAALSAAAAIADGEATHVVALAVLDPGARGDGREPGAADMAGRRRSTRESFGKARDAARAATRAWATLHFTEGTDAARTICEYAALHCFDLVVLGRRGNGGVPAPRLGHVAETAAMSSSVPVLLLTGR